MNFDPQLVRLLNKSGLAFTITIALGITGGVLAIAQAHSFTKIVDQVFLKDQSLHQVIPMLLTLLMLIAGRAMVSWGYEAAGSAIAKPIKHHLRCLLYRQVIERGPVFLDRLSTGELVNTTVEGVEALDGYYSQYVPQVILAGVIPLLYLAFIAPVDWISALVMLLTAPLIPLFMVLIGKMAQTLTRRQWLSLNRMSAYFLDVLQGLPTLKSLGRSREQARVIAWVSQRYAQTTLGVLRVAFLSAMTLELFATLSVAVVAVQLGLRLLYGWISFEQALFVLALAPDFYLPLRMLGTRFHAGMAGVEAGKRVVQLLSDKVSGEQVAGDRASGVQGGSKKRIENGDMKKVNEQSGGMWLDKKQKWLPPIRFQEVRFEYEAGRAAIDGASFTINPGENIALVGESGAGKSTLVALLMGFLLPKKGEIFIGDVPLSEIPIDDWRESIAWVPQKPYFFHDSVAANIRLADPQASMEAVIMAARLAHADEFIRALPQGYETLIGERGTRLSAGQAQRIALARAFLKDAPMLILDEGTAHLDAAAASHVQQAIYQLAAGRTVIVIAHRLPTIRQADRILVLDNGRIVQSGSHASLSQQDGPYRSLIESDFARFSEHIKIDDAGCQGIDNLQTQNTEANLIFNAENDHKNDNQILTTDHFSPLTNHSSLALFTRLICLIAPYTGWIALSALLGFATVASSVGLAATSAYIISAAALQPSIAGLQLAIVGVRFFGLSRGVLRYLERYVSHKVTLQVLGRLRVWFYEALEPLAPACLMQHSGDLLSRITGDIGSLENFYVRALYPPLVAALATALLGIYLGMVSLQLAAAVLAVFLTASIALPGLMNRLGKTQGRQLVEKRSKLSERLVEGIQGLADLLIYGQANSQAQRIDDASHTLESSHQRMASLNGLQNGLMGLLSNLSLWLVLWLAVPLVNDGLIPGVYLAGLALAALAGFEAAAPLSLAGQYLESNLQAARRLFELADTQPEVVDPPNPLPLPERFDLDVQNLSFGYPEYSIRHPLNQGMRNDDPSSYVLHNLSFSLPEGERIAVIGPSGAGKTTLINLLLRFWEYHQGSITLGGYELRRYRADDLRQLMAVVSQNTTLFNATLRENLLLAQPTASEEAIQRALKQAQLEDLVKALPQGIDTWLGEQGVRLSAGERQRVAIARALLKDVPILILDEATANLDTVTAREVMEALEKAMEGRSVIMVTHEGVGGR